MAWWNDYDRGYSSRYDRGGMHGGGSARGAHGQDTGYSGGESTGRYRSSGGESTGRYRGAGGESTGRYRSAGGESTGRYRSAGGRGSVYGYDYGYARDYRVAPEQSPSYGRSGDEQVRRWARTHGYDEGMEISPRSGSRGSGGYSSGQSSRGTVWQGGNRSSGNEGRGGSWWSRDSGSQRGWSGGQQRGSGSNRDYRW